MNGDRVLTKGRARSRGAATVEAVVTLPLLVLLVLATVDVGQYVIVGQAVSNASREAARLAARHTTSSVSEVETAAADYLVASFPSASIQVNVTDADGTAIPAGDLTNLSTGSAMSVEVVFQFNGVRWIDVVPLLNNSAPSTTTIVRRE